jgi:hypothetical protein
MSQIFEYTGVVEEVLPVQTFSSGFTKRDIIIGNDVDSPSKYPNPGKFSFKKDNCSLLDGVRKGQRAKVRFAVDGRVWQDPKTGKNRYFTDLTALKLELLDADGTSTEPMPDPADVPADVLAGDTEDLPF